jgi:hypothetical protein
MRQPTDRNRGTLALLLTMGLVLPALAGCSPSRDAETSPASGASVAGQVGESQSAAPRVPFGGQPCRSLSTADLKRIGFATPGPPKPGRSPDDLALDNVCEFGELSIEFTTQKDYVYQRDKLRSHRQTAPADLPGAFYDVLGNLWFAKKGYSIVIANTVEDKQMVDVARAIAAKL